MVKTFSFIFSSPLVSHSSGRLWVELGSKIFQEIQKIRVQLFLARENGKLINLLYIEISRGGLAVCIHALTFFLSLPAFSTL